MSDNNPVITVDISKGDRFYFSRVFDKDAVEKLLVDARIKYESIKDIPILPDVLSKLEDKIMRRSIFSTAAIEGNSHTEEEVGEIISDNIEESKERKDVEITNLFEIYSELKEEKENPSFVINEEMIKKSHFTITKNIDNPENVPGKYRAEPCKIGDPKHGGTYHPPKSRADINSLMKIMTEIVSGGEYKDLHPFIQAALIHYYFALIHPFGDGNGRTARYLEALILKNSGFKYVYPLLSNEYYKHIDEYYLAFSLSQKSKERDITPFITFVLTALNDTLLQLKGDILGSIRFLAVRDYINSLRDNKEITQRQFDLLNILVYEPSKTINKSKLMYETPYNVLYRSVSGRTVARDISILRGKNLLIQNENNDYKINIAVLG